MDGAWINSGIQMSIPDEVSAFTEAVEDLDEKMNDIYVSEGERVEAEEARVAAEGTLDESTEPVSGSGRLYYEYLRQASETARATAERDRLEAEGVLDETQIPAVGTGRKYAEYLRNIAEQTRKNTEGVGATDADCADGTRRKNEAGRVAAELARVAAESARAAAESGRNAAYEAAEAVRDGLFDTAEEARSGEWDEIKAEVTDAISDAEDATSAANTAAGNATTAASSADTAATAANNAATAANTAAEEAAEAISSLATEEISETAESGAITLSLKNNTVYTVKDDEAINTIKISKVNLNKKITGVAYIVFLSEDSGLTFQDATNTIQWLNTEVSSYHFEQNKWYVITIRKVGGLVLGEVGAIV